MTYGWNFDKKNNKKSSKKDITGKKRNTYAESTKNKIIEMFDLGIRPIDIADRSEEVFGFPIPRLSVSSIIKQFHRLGRMNTYVDKKYAIEKWNNLVKRYQKIGMTEKELILLFSEKKEELENYFRSKINELDKILLNENQINKLISSFKEEEEEEEEENNKFGSKYYYDDEDIDSINRYKRLSKLERKLFDET